MMTRMNIDPKAAFQKLKLSLRYLLRILKLLNSAGKVYILPIVFLGLASSVIPSASALIMQEIVNSLQLFAEDLWAAR